MNGKELLLRALTGGECERAPWVPFSGVHAGHLLGVNPRDFLQSADRIVEGIVAVVERYQPDGVPVIFDLQVEAEILGCALEWSEDTPPAVKGHVLAGGEAKGIAEWIEQAKFKVDQGRMPLALEATRRLKASVGDRVALYGLVTGPLTLALHLRSAEFFMDLFMQPEEAKNLLAFCADVAAQSARAYLDAGADIIAVVDPMISQISAEHFEGFVSEPLNVVFDAVRNDGGLSSLFVCGDATRNLEVMCETHCDNISVDENIDLASLKVTALKHGKSFGGNLRLTTTLLLGTALDCQKNAIECMDIGGTKGFVLAPGCDLPYATPAENLEAVAEVVHDPYKLEVARSITPELVEDGFDDVEIPDYKECRGIIVDVVTLDSSACAPCQYMYGLHRRLLIKWGMTSRWLNTKSKRVKVWLI